MLIIALFCLCSCGKGCKKEKLTEHTPSESVGPSEKTGLEIFMETGTVKSGIFDGEDTPITEAPWQVSFYRGNDPFQGHRCGGIIINENWILTAAHCFFDDWPNLCKRLFYENDFKIFYGSNNLKSQGGTAEIDKIFLYEDYKYCDYLIDDIALIRTKEPLNLGTAKKIILPDYIDVSTLIYSKDTATVSGWGKTRNENKTIILQSVKVPLVTTEICMESYPNSIYKSMICAGYKDGGKDSCNGDSGGPLSVEIYGNQILIGIVSWGYPSGCGIPDKYGVYTNVKEFTPWINETINKPLNETSPPLQ